MGSITKTQLLGGLSAAVVATALMAALPGEIADPPGAEMGHRDRARHGCEPVATSAPDSVLLRTSPGLEFVAAAPLMETRVTPEESSVRSRRTVAVEGTARAMLNIGPDPAFARATALDLTFVSGSADDCLQRVRDGSVAMALVGERRTVADTHGGLHRTLLGVELFGLAVAEDFPLRSVSERQARQLLTGELGDWSELGCDRGPVVVVAPSGTGRTSLSAEALTGGAGFVSSTVRVADEIRVADQLQRRPGAIAVVRIGPSLPPGVRLLRVDWAPPTRDAWRRGAYPFGLALHLVTVDEPRGLAARLLATLRSETR